MKKPVAALIVLAVAGAAALLPWYFGKKAEASYRDYIARINSYPLYEVELINYERGWLKSTANYRITYGALGAAAETDPEVAKLTTYQISDVIYHGPLPMAPDFEGNALPSFALAAFHGELYFDEDPFFYQMIAGPEKPLLRYGGAIGTSGKVTVHAVNDPINFAPPGENTALDWKGLSIKATVDGDKLTTGLYSEGLKVDSPQGSMSLGPIEAKSDGIIQGAGLVTGDGEFVIIGASYGVGEQTLMTMVNMKFAATTSLDEGLLNETGTLDIERFFIMDKPLAPLHADFAVNNLNYEKLLAISQDGDQMAERFENDPEGAEAMIEQQFLALAADGPSMRMDNFSMETVGGTVTGRAEAGITPEKIADSTSADAIEKAVYTTFKFSIPRAAMVELEKIGATQQAFAELMSENPNNFPSEEVIAMKAERIAQRNVDEMVSAGALTAEGDMLVIEGEIRDGRSVINGKEEKF